MDRTSIGPTIEAHGFAIGVDWYGEASRQKTYLGEDFSAVGAVPVLVRLENRGTRPLDLRLYEIKLQLPGGKHEDEYPVGSAASLFHQPAGGSDNVLLNSPYGWVFTLGGMQSSGQASHDASRARHEQFERKALPRGVIAPGESRQGFVFFMVGAHAPFNEATLLVPLANPSSSEIVHLTVPMKGIQSPQSPKKP